MSLIEGTRTGERPPAERIRDWEEFALPPDERTQCSRAARCMNCGVPFCHSGEVFGRAVSGCPAGSLIPDWNGMLALGLYREAWERLSYANPLPEMTGRVCPAPCEAACVGGLRADAVTIRRNELFIAEKAFENGWVVESGAPAARSGKQVAVAGSGPSGLACAWTLNRLGHDVTVFERAEQPGGLLIYGIPAMKLSKRIVARRITAMTEAGVRFVTGVRAGTDISPSALESGYGAVVLCCGAAKARDLCVPGRRHPGIFFASEYLSDTARTLLGKGPGALSGTLSGKSVLIIGGGDTGNDCVATVIRMGAGRVTQLEIMPCPPDGRLPGNPWPQWPAVRKTDYGHEEAIHVQGTDPRNYCVSTTAFTGDSRGVTGADTVLVDWAMNDRGRLEPVPIRGTERHYPADLVLLALGFAGPDENMLALFGVTPSGGYGTGREKIFMAGDMRRGQSLVAWAVREGCEAARAVHNHLSED